MIIYNVNTLGKSPYYIGDLWTFKEETFLDYNPPVDVSNDADITLSGQEWSGRVSVTGTHRDIRTRSARDTNYIDGIDSIKAVLYADENDPSGATLTFTFDVNQDSPAKDFAKVPEGELMVMLYNARSLEIYQYYHMLDAYGAVQCKFYSALADDETTDDGRGWGVHAIARSEKRPLLDSFFEDEPGIKTYLDSVQLSDYDALSDVYVYRGNKMLSFKNDEEYRFPTSSDMYYYPTLNLSYPKKPAQRVESNTSFSVNSQANVSVMYDIFDESNLFVI